jgi:ParB family chromosome partitioning protein
MRDIELKNLRFGHEEGAPPSVVNVRQVGRDDGLDALAASIDAHGLIQPLTVVPGDNGKVYVVDGNRRLAALRLLEQAEKMKPAECIPVVIAPDEGSAREIGLAANVMRAALHPADQYVAFQQLSEEGQDEAAIARRFGMPPIQVRRILAIGSLSPKVIDAWRVGDFGRDESGVVRAFTMAPDHAEQDRVLAKLSKAGQLYPHIIRRALGADDGEAAKHLKVAGIDAYRAAGGRMVEDLFGDDHAVLDPALAKKLATEALQAECFRLMTTGWSWAKLAGELPENAGWNWSILPSPPKKVAKGEAKRIKELDAVIEETRHQDPAVFRAAVAERDGIQQAQVERSYGDAEKAKSGCIVSIGHYGAIQIKFGVVDPKTQKPERASTSRSRASGEEASAPTLSNALVHRLSVQMTLGLQAAVKSHPHVALAMLLAGASCSTVQNSPVRVRLDGFGSTTYRPDGESFHDLFERFVGMTLEQLAEAAAEIASQAITFEAHQAGNPIATHPGAIAITSALDPARTAEAMSSAFDATDYFGSASKPIVLKAIEEALNPDEARKAGKLKKAELVQFAVGNVVGKGWLPPEIRPATYSGPGAPSAPMAQAAE